MRYRYLIPGFKQLTKSVVMQACYGILSMSKEFNFLTFKYDVITGQCNDCDIREKVFTDFYRATLC